MENKKLKFFNKLLELINLFISQAISHGSLKLFFNFNHLINLMF